jgi:microcystin degradation protein MlrC
MKAMERRQEVLAVNLFMCHPFNDSKDLGWSVQVVCDGNAGLASSLADELADRAWAVRKKLPPKFLSASEGVEKARANRIASRFGTVCLVDASDVVPAGATGDNTRVLKAILQEGQDLIAYVPVRDAAVVEALWQKTERDLIDMAVGGAVNPKMNVPIRITGRIIRRAETTVGGRTLVVAVGKTRIVITERPPLTLKPSFYSDVGLNPWRADLVVVKSFFHFRIFFLAVNRRSFLVKTKGITDFELPTGNEFNDPVFPKDNVQDWRSADSRRRAIAG